MVATIPALGFDGAGVSAAPCRCNGAAFAATARLDGAALIFIQRQRREPEFVDRGRCQQHGRWLQPDPAGFSVYRFDCRISSYAE